MREVDKFKPLEGKAQKTINFDKPVLLKLEMLSQKDHSTVSNIVNHIVKKIVLDDAAYCDNMAKYYNDKMLEWKFLKDQAIIRKETR